VSLTPQAISRSELGIRTAFRLTEDPGASFALLSSLDAVIDWPNNSASMPSGSGQVAANHPGD